VSRYQEGKNQSGFTGARDNEWQWHHLSHMQIICKSAPRLRQITMLASHHTQFLQARCPSCCQTTSVKALKALKNMCLLMYFLCQKRCKTVTLNVVMFWTHCECRRYYGSLYKCCFHYNTFIPSRFCTEISRRKIFCSIRRRKLSKSVTLASPKFFSARVKLTQ